MSALADSDVERIARRTAEILNGGGLTPQTVLNAHGLMIRLGCESESAAYRLAARLKIRAFARGKYRAADVDAAIARAAYNASRRVAA